MFFTKFTKGCSSKRVGILIYNTGKGYFLTGYSEKGINFKMSNTLFRVSFAIGTQLTSKPPPRPPGTPCKFIVQMSCIMRKHVFRVFNQV